MRPQAFSLSGTGPSMVAWMYGVGHELARSGLLRARGGAPPPRVTGVSGGAIAALLLATDVDLALDGAFWTLNGENMRRATKHKELSTRDAMRETLDAVLPRDAPALASARAGLTVVAAHGPMRAWPARPPIVIDEFRDRADLLDAVSASFHIPFAMDGRASAPWRGAPHVDAGALGKNLTPVPGAVHVSVLPDRAFAFDRAAMPAQPAPLRAAVWLAASVMVPCGTRVDVHPWLVQEHASAAADFLMGNVPIRVHEERFRRGQEAFHVWARAEGYLP